MNEYVKWVQETLIALGYDPGAADGLAGEHTLAAVIAFQQDHNLEADGLVGTNTNNALLLALNKRIGDSLLEPPAPQTDFAPGEFACSCGCGLDVAAKLKSFAQSLREAFDWPLTISSGARCPTVNREAGGAPDSCHLTGEAFDAYFAGHMSPGVMEAMADFALEQGFGVIRYPEELFCHFQVYPRNSIMY